MRATLYLLDPATNQPFTLHLVEVDQHGRITDALFAPVREAGGVVATYDTALAQSGCAWRIDVDMGRAYDSWCAMGHAMRPREDGFRRWFGCGGSKVHG